MTTAERYSATGSERKGHVAIMPSCFVTTPTGIHRAMDRQDGVTDKEGRACSGFRGSRRG
jgi:hypothetical protein